jgi:heat-inducible transcriptional repressor
MRVRPVAAHHLEQIENEITPAGTAIEQVLRRAAQVLGVLTQELGVALAPTLDGLVLERVELVRPSSDRLVVVLTLQSGLVRTIFVEVPTSVAADAVEQVSRILNERLAGLTLREIRASLPERLRDADQSQEGKQLLNVFVAQGEDLFDLSAGDASVLLGSAQPLVGQPEFASNDRMRGLLSLTERRDLLRRAFEEHHRRGVTITIGSENDDPRLAEFTLVTSPYRSGQLSGVVGVLGPTRMPYDKIIGLVEQTSRMVEGLMS